MQKFLIRYSMKPEFADENEKLLRAYINELERAHPAGMAYAVNRLEDGVGFFHVVESVNLAEPFAQLESFRTRAEWAKGKYDVEPVLHEFMEIGGYRVK